MRKLMSDVKKSAMLHKHAVQLHAMGRSFVKRIVSVEAAEECASAIRHLRRPCFNLQY